MHAVRADLEIVELTPGGEGVGHVAIGGERRAVFVPGVARGEHVRVEIDPRSRPARGVLLQVLAPSSERAAPACAFVDRCGGCDWMHLTIDAQRAEHASIVEKLLGVAVGSHPAPRTIGYRTRARVHVEATKRGAIVAGMYARKSHEPAAVATCIVLDPALDRARLALAELLAGARGRGEASLALGAERRPVIELRWRGELAAATFGRLERAVANGEIAGASVYAGEVKVPAKIGDPTPIVTGADGAPLRLAPGGFAQANDEANAELARRVAELAGDAAPAVELYAGAGNLTVMLAPGRELVAVESNEDACAAARDNLAARGLSAKVKVVAGDAAAFVLPKATRLLVLDPPREGARDVCAAIAAGKTKLSRIVYVSCDPPTLARDVKLLVAAGWSLVTAETFEMFPHTSHVETVALLERRSA
ncbi:MAG: class I SAM-dependent RNA methyltransferase [Labilithrix sp.]|nr:class I SAM-dependent RNA methyltransferase [Labilithrix sp.]MCW5813518.1 class I SAM-dependent RNA methyltransferase [Labilithrix sp.]